jgi:hypothetical protein
MVLFKLSLLNILATGSLGRTVIRYCDKALFVFIRHFKVQLTGVHAGSASFCSNSRFTKISYL